MTLWPTGDPALNAHVSAAYQAKYGNQASWLDMFLRAPATETTLRLDRPDA